MSMEDIRKYEFPHECYFEQNGFEVTVNILDVDGDNERYTNKVEFEITDQVFDECALDLGEPMDHDFLYDQVVGYCEEMGWI